MDGKGNTLSTSTQTKREVTQEHLDALRKGRDESRAVKAYLAHLKNHKPKRGRKPAMQDIGSINARLEKIKEELAAESDALKRLHLLSEETKLENAANTLLKSDAPDGDQLEKDFIAVAKSFSDRRGIDRATWRKVGVSSEVLRKAGIK